MFYKKILVFRLQNVTVKFNVLLAVSLWLFWNLLAISEWKLFQMKSFTKRFSVCEFLSRKWNNNIINLYYCYDNSSSPTLSYCDSPNRKMNTSPQKLSITYSIIEMNDNIYCICMRHHWNHSGITSVQMRSSL